MADFDINYAPEINRKQHEWRETECINLIASENAMSPLARKAYDNAFMHRYAEGLPHKRYYQGVKYIDELEEKTTELAKKIFGCPQADLRPISGAMANLCVFGALCQPHDPIIVPSVPMGAHITHQKFGCAGMLGLDIHEYVFDYDSMSLDITKTEEKIKMLKPKLMTLGASVFTFPHPVKEVSRLAHDIGAKLMYDGAHVFGFIAAKRFQDPFAEGADLITASTHKTFPGPQGGIVLGNTDEETWKKVQRKIFPALVSNHHLHRLPAMYVTLLEMQEFGAAYADQIIKNAQHLGKALHSKGFDVLWKDRGFTQSHQLAIDVSKIGGGKFVAEELEKANLIVNKNLLPTDDTKKSQDPSGIRLGVQEMTHFGMKEAEMAQIAELFERILMKKENPEKIKDEVTAVRKRFLEVQYCFKVLSAK